MGLEILVLVGLIMTAGGKPVEVNGDAEPHRPYSAILNSYPARQASEVLRSSISSATGEVFHTESHPSIQNQKTSDTPSAISVSGSSIHVQEPHTLVASGSPVAKGFAGMESSPSLDMLILNQKDPVESDFSITGSDNPEAESSSGPAALNGSALKPSLTGDSQELSRASPLTTSANFVKPYPDATSDADVTREFTNDEKHSFSNSSSSTTEDQTDPVQSDFSASRITGVPAGGPVSTRPYKRPAIVSNSSVNGNESPISNIPDAQATNVSENSSGRPLEDEVVVSSTSVNGEEHVTVTTVTTVAGNEVKNQEFVNVTSRSISAEVFNSSVNTEESVVVATPANIRVIKNSVSDQKEMKTSLKENTATSSSVNGQEHVTVPTVTTAAGSEVNNQEFVKVTGRPVSAEVLNGSVNTEEPVLVVTPTNIKATKNSVNDQNEMKMSSKESTVSSSSVNGQERVIDSSLPKETVDQTESASRLNEVISAQMFSEDGSLSNTPVNKQQPVTDTDHYIVSGTVSQIQTQNLSTAKIPIEEQERSTENSVFSISVNTEAPVTVGTGNSSVSREGSKTPEQHLNVLNQSNNSQMHSEAISAFTTFINGQEPVATLTASNPASEISQVINSQTDVNTGSQTFSKEISAFNNSVNEQEPVAVVTAIYPAAESNDRMQNHPPKLSDVSETDSKSSGKFSFFVNGADSVIWVSNPFVSHLQNPLFSTANNLIGQLTPIESQLPLTEFSVPSSPVNGQEPVTVITASNLVSGVVNPIPNHQFSDANKPTGEQILSGGVSVSGSSVNNEEPVTVVTTANPISGALGQIQNQQLNSNSRPTREQIFPAFSSGFLNQVNDQFAINTANGFPGGKITGSSILSSTSTDGKKIHTVVTSTDSLTGEVTQTRYESSAGRPVGVYQQVSSSSTDGEKSQTIISFKNPITGEVSQMVHHSSSAGKPLQSATDGKVEATVRTFSNATDDGQVMNISASATSNGNESITEQTAEEIFVAGNPTDDYLNQTVVIFKNPSAEGITPEPFEANSSEEKFLNKVAAGASDSAKIVPSIMATSDKDTEPIKNVAVGVDAENIPGKQVSPGVVVSTGSLNGQKPVTILTISNPSTGSSVQTKYATQPLDFVSNAEEQNSQQKVAIASTSIKEHSSQVNVTPEASSREEETPVKNGSLVDVPNSHVEDPVVSSAVAEEKNLQEAPVSTNPVQGEQVQTRNGTLDVSVTNVPNNGQIVPGTGTAEQAKV